MKIPLIDDVLKGLPDNARLRGQIEVYLKRIKELEGDVASLKDDKRELRTEIQKLRRCIAELEPEEQTSGANKCIVFAIKRGDILCNNLCSTRTKHREKRQAAEACRPSGLFGLSLS